MSDAKMIGVSIPYSWELNLTATASMVIIFPLFGMLADYLGSCFKSAEKGITFEMKLGLALAIVLMIPAMLLLCVGGLGSAIWAQIFFVIIMSSFGSCLPAFMIIQFPPELRYAGMGISYNIAQAIFSGTAPFIQTEMVLSGHQPVDHMSDNFFEPLRRNDSRLWPAYYIIAVAFLSFIAMLLAKGGQSFEKKLSPEIPRTEEAPLYTDSFVQSTKFGDELLPPLVFVIVPQTPYSVHETYASCPTLDNRSAY